MASLRTKEGEQRYREHQANHPNDGTCPLCTKEPLRSFVHWKIILNDFPYDLVAETHHMIIPNRHVTESELTADEIREYAEIKEEVLHKEYDYMIETTRVKKSIPDHFHLHLIVAK